MVIFTVDHLPSHGNQSEMPKQWKYFNLSKFQFRQKALYAVSPDPFLNEAFGKGSGYARLLWKSTTMALPLEDQTAKRIVA